MQFKRIVVGVDGSAGAEAALRWAAEAVGQAGEVLAVQGVARPLLGQAAASAATGLGMFPQAKGRKEEGRDALERWCRPLRDADVPYRAIVVDADPVDAVLNTARTEDADLVVVGHQGETGMLHRLFQGLSDHLVDHARRPVVVVPTHPATL